jgi:hypothetical protein
VAALSDENEQRLAAWLGPHPLAHQTTPPLVAKVHAGGTLSVPPACSARSQREARSRRADEDFLVIASPSSRPPEPGHPGNLPGTLRRVCPPEPAHAEGRLAPRRRSNVSASPSAPPLTRPRTARTLSEPARSRCSRPPYPSSARPTAPALPLAPQKRARPHDQHRLASPAANPPQHQQPLLKSAARRARTRTLHVTGP